MNHLSKWQKTLMILAICATNLTVMADFIIVPVANDLFMEYDEILVNYILSGPSLVQIAGGFLSGMIMARFGSKKTLTISFGLFTICGLIMSFYNTAIALAVFRSIAAFAIAVINATSMAIIANTMEPAIMGSIMGIYNASMSLTVTSTFPILAGLAAVLLVLSIISTRNYYKAAPEKAA